MAFPTSLYIHTTLIDNTDDVLAQHPNTLGAEIEAIESKLGINSSGITSSVDYKLTHLPAQLSGWDAGSVELRAQTFYSDQAAGTAPFTVVSNTMVPNLNAQFLNGIVSSGYVQTTGTQTVSGTKTFTNIPILPATNPTQDNEATRKAYVDSVGFLPGDVVSTAASAASRTGFLLCDGSSYARTAYVNLFNAIGTTYGSVDSNSFNVPNMTNKFMRGNTPSTGGGSDTHAHGSLTGVCNNNTYHAGPDSYPIPDQTHKHTISDSDNIPVYTGFKFWIKT